MYRQSSGANNLDGGRDRTFPLMEGACLQSDLLQRLVRADLSWHDRTWGGAKPTVLGLHQVRYRATPGRPSFSSPIWLHKDDESVVFLHLIQTSDSLVGGDTVIAQSETEDVEAVIQLAKELDTIVLTRDVFHCVTPIGCAAGRAEATRDILLVTVEQYGSA